VGVISLTVGETELTKYLTSFKVNRSPVEINGGGDDFVNWDGTSVSSSVYMKTVITADVCEVPDDKAADLDNALNDALGTDEHGEQKDGTIDVSYSSPGDSSGKFKCTSYSAEPDEGTFEESGNDPKWNISLTLESQPEADDEGSGGV